MPHRNKVVSNIKRRRKRIFEGHEGNTGTIGHVRKIARITGTDRVDNTKELERSLSISIGHYKGQITNIH